MLHTVSVSHRPMLRGYLHLGAALAAAVGGAYLVLVSSGDVARQLSMLVYATSLTLLFAVSAAYHVRIWSPVPTTILRRLDHANIFVLIAATYTPVATSLLSEWSRLGVLATVWCGAVAGAGAAFAGVELRRWLRSAIYVALGWIGVAAVVLSDVPLPPLAIALVLAGGILYSLGAFLYARRWPDLWPRVFGYHEVFHLLTIAAAVLFYAVVLLYVLPASRG